MVAVLLNPQGRMWWPSVARLSSGLGRVYGTTRAAVPPGCIVSQRRHCLSSRRHCLVTLLRAGSPLQCRPSAVDDWGKSGARMTSQLWFPVCVTGSVSCHYVIRGYLHGRHRWTVILRWRVISLRARLGCCHRSP